jgi:hypothetical protein
VNFILSMSPAFRTTDVVVTMQLLVTLDGVVVDALQNSVKVRIGSNNRCGFAFNTVRTENLNVTAGGYDSSLAPFLVISGRFC